ncbi:hypothetical protein M427DRAFT_38054 [Gonapodya prolifera JEL478]|uniref:DDHD domain-containing protein n=1 Tax=Gonapodya prolifera (strain JEL478) TaxID=1344416 RepID=A0A138ZZV9_GONPJ|nr:hypothetical protein M427DRAFT_38054 [Gonapodya prolifera JEL478]|eukprot:KXS09948.1 hypothetical protein M427DRAFT_38054 [Gonapodya prolifera JEL478]
MELRAPSKPGSQASGDDVPETADAKSSAPAKSGWSGWQFPWSASSSPITTSATPKPSTSSGAIVSRRSKSMGSEGAAVGRLAFATKLPDVVVRAESPVESGAGTATATGTEHAVQTYTEEAKVDPPDLTIRWFHATDIPLRDESPFKLQSTTSLSGTARVEPQQWLAFSARDNREIEARYQEWLAHGGREAEERRGRKREREREREREKEKAREKTAEGKDPTTNVQDDSELELAPIGSLAKLSGVDALETEVVQSSGRFKVAVGEDLLFEVDVEAREMMPVPGPVYEIRRGSWFYQNSSKMLPCDDNLAKQLEDGYLKFKPWLDALPPISRPISEVPSPSVSPAASPKPPQEPLPHIPRSPSHSPARSPQPPPQPQPLAAPPRAFITSPSPSPDPAQKRSPTPTVPGSRTLQAGEDPLAAPAIAHTTSPAFHSFSPHILIRRRTSLTPAPPAKEIEAAVSVAPGTPGEAPGSGSAPLSTSPGPDSTLAAPAAVAPVPVPAKPAAIDWSKKWSLFPPHQGRTAVYVGHNRALVMADSVLVTVFVSAVGYGGETVVRGYDEAARQVKGVGKDKDKEKDKEKEKEKEKEKGVGVGGAGDAKEAKEEAANMEEKDYADDEMQGRRVDHLVFVLHGIGQKMGEASSLVNFVHDCNQLRRAIKDASKAILANAVAGAPSTSTTGDTSTPPVNLPPPGSGVQILPVLWRHLVDFGIRRTPDHATLDDVSLDSVPILRLLTKNFVTDLMLYMEPHHRGQLVRAVAEELTRMYTIYVERNPGKPRPKVSVVGHSLGSQIALDVLAAQPEGEEDMAGSVVGEGTDLSELVGGGGSDAAVPRDIVGDNVGEGIRKVEVGRLPFEVESLFALGSPIGFFLVLKKQTLRARSASGSGATSSARIVRPKCRAVYNVFFPTDMVAHKVEPTVSPTLAGGKPVSVAWTKGGIQGSLNTVAQGGAAIMSQVRSWGAMIPAHIIAGAVSRVAGVRPGGDGGVPMGGAGAATAGQARAAGAGGFDEKGAGYGDGEESADALLRALNPRHGRLDFALQVDMLQPELLQAVGAHFAYFADADVAHFVLGELYGS